MNYIKQTLNTKGWEEIEQIFAEEILKKSVDYKTDNIDYETVAVQAIALKEASKMVTKALNRIRIKGNAQIIDKETYK